MDIDIDIDLDTILCDVFYMHTDPHTYMYTYIDIGTYLPTGETTYFGRRGWLK